MDLSTGLLILIALVGIGLAVYSRRRGSIKKSTRGLPGALVFSSDGRVRQESLTPEQYYERFVWKFTNRIQQDPSNAVAYSDRGGVLLMLKRYQDAITDLDQAIKLKPDHADAYSNRGLAYYAQKMYEDALANYNRAIELAPDDPVYYLNRGQSHRQVGSYEQSLTDLNRALEIRPDLYDALKERGVTYYKLGDKRSALTDLQRYQSLTGPILTDRDALVILLELESEQETNQSDHQ